MKPLRVCMVSYYLPPVHSGAGKQAVTLAEQLRGDCEVMLLTARHGPLPVFEECNGLKIYRLGGTGSGTAFAVVFILRLAWWLLWWRKRYDVVHTHGYPLFYFVPLAVLRMLGKPNLYTMSMLGADDPQQLFIGRLGPLRKTTYRWIDVKVATSAEMNRLCSEGPTEYIGRHEQIPYGVDINRFRPVTEEERRASRVRQALAPGQPVALFVGAIVDRKGVAELLRAWAIVLQAVPNAHLWLIGPTRYLVNGEWFGDEYVASVKNLAVQLGIESQIRFLGERNDVDEFMRCADVFCLASKQEGLPIVFIEALASGTPIVSFDVAGAQDTVFDGETGFQVPMGDIAAFGKAVTKVFCDDKLRQQMGARGRALARERFALDIIAQKYLSVYRSLVGLDSPR